MIYEQVKHLKPEDFKRLCGVRPETFNQDDSHSVLEYPSRAHRTSAATVCC